MQKFKTIALSHHVLGLEDIGKFHIEPDDFAGRFADTKAAFSFSEFMYISTCNRVEFLMVCDQQIDAAFVQRLLAFHFPEVSNETRQKALKHARQYEGLDAVRHIFNVASSLDSLVLGEREIITQVRQSYETAKDLNLSGDFLRLMVRKAIETAKQIYTETNIATRPVSVVNLAYRKLIEATELKGQDLILVGAGQTMTAMASNLIKAKHANIRLFNRTLENSVHLANRLKASNHTLNELSKVRDFDVLITCTASQDPVVDAAFLKRLDNPTKRRVIVDLAIPHDTDPSVATDPSVEYIAIEDLKEEAKRNLKLREKELFRCEALVAQRLDEFEEAYKTRKLELAMREVPEIMKNIRSHAVGNKFSKQLDELNPDQRALVNELLDYLEKKYISIPMKMAKEVVLSQDLKDKIIG